MKHTQIISFNEEEQENKDGLAYSCAIQVHGEAPVTVVEGMVFKSIDFKFELKEESRWSLEGAVGVKLLEAEYTLEAGLEIDDDSRAISLKACRQAETPLLKLGDLASLDVSDVVLKIKKALKDEADDNAEAGTGADKESTQDEKSPYTWSLMAGGAGSQSCYPLPLRRHTGPV